MRGCSDTEILAWIASVGGTDAFLEQAFRSLSEVCCAKPPEATGAVIEWDIYTPDGGVVGYHLEADQGAWRVARGASFRSRVVFAVDMANFVRLLIGTLDGGEAVSDGTVQVSGDVALANMIRAWFEANPQPSH